MERLLRWAFGNVVRTGNLRITTARGSSFTVGDGTGKPLAMRFTSADAERGVLMHPELRFGEAYMDGGLTVEQGTITDVLAVLLGHSSGTPGWARIRWLARFLYRRLAQFNPRSRARRNVAHHYDLDGQLYALFLDADRQYSCAYFENPDQSLDDAQLAKKRHLAAKLLVGNDDRVLDIGCGWGGLALYLAEVCRARVTGITLSQQQHAAARVRASEKGLAERTDFHLQDYRDVSGKFDRIVSVGMFEHVGVGFLWHVFSANAVTCSTTTESCCCTRSDVPRARMSPIRGSRNISSPAATSRRSRRCCWRSNGQGLLVTDIEILRLHYAETLKAWRERFLAQREQVERLYDQRFVRMWEFYLAASEMAFREQNMMVFQLQLTKRQG